MLIISPKLFFHKYGPAAQNSPELIFHIINMFQDSSVSLSVIWLSVPSSMSFNVLVEISSFNQINCNYANLRPFSIIWKPIFCGKSFSMNIEPSRTGRLLKSVSAFLLKPNYCMANSSQIWFKWKISYKKLFFGKYHKKLKYLLSFVGLFMLFVQIRWKDKIIETDFS